VELKAEQGDVLVDAQNISIVTGKTGVMGSL
jgi:hypothetical protein